MLWTRQPQRQNYPAPGGRTGSRWWNVRILIIEDEPKIARSLSESFQAEHFAVDMAEDGEKGLQLATTNNDTRQIFYLAINLAFLQLVGNEDLTAMKNMAEMALVNAEKSNDDFWKLATLAEAQLYLGDFEKAKDHYLKAILVAGDDRRAINSMYINASYSCHALQREDWGLEIENIFITTRRQP